jgi:hypothetical protein
MAAPERFTELTQLVRDAPLARPLWDWASRAHRDDSKTLTVDTLQDKLNVGGAVELFYATRQERVW